MTAESIGPCWHAPRGSDVEGALLGRQRDDADRADGLARARLRLHVREQRLDLLANERLLLEERVRDPVERRAVLRDEAQRLGVRLVREAGLLGVARLLRLLRERVVVRAHRP